VCKGISATLIFLDSYVYSYISCFNKYGRELAVSLYCYLAAERINTKMVHTEEIQNVTGREGNLHDFLSFSYKIKFDEL